MSVSIGSAMNELPPVSLREVRFMCVILIVFGAVTEGLEKDY